VKRPPAPADHKNPRPVSMPVRSKPTSIGIGKKSWRLARVLQPMSSAREPAGNFIINGVVQYMSRAVAATRPVAQPWVSCRQTAAHAPGTSRLDFNESYTEHLRRSPPPTSCNFRGVADWGCARNINRPSLDQHGPGPLQIEMLLPAAFPVCCSQPMRAIGQRLARARARCWVRTGAVLKGLPSASAVVSNAVAAAGNLTDLGQTRQALARGIRGT